MEADESCTPDLVEDNYAAQVMNATFEYLLKHIQLNYIMFTSPF